MNCRSGCSPPRRGGVAAPSKNAAKPPCEGADGVVSPGSSSRSNVYHNDHPVCAASEASRLFITGASTPPVPGGEHLVLPIHSHLLKPATTFGKYRKRAPQCSRGL